MTSDKMNVELYTDGAARGNPNGPGGYGCILRYMGKSGKLYEREYSGGFKQTTNNRMELMAAIIGLENLTRPCSVKLYSDSKYLTDTFNKGWIKSWERRGWKRGANKEIKNLDLWQRLLEAAKPHDVQFIWVRGHNGNELNERCDFLATSAADRLL